MLSKRWLLAAVWAGAIAFIIWLADTGRARPFFNWIERHTGSDKVGHFVLVGGMAFFANLALRGRRVGPIQLGSLIVAVVFVAEEFTQRNFATRMFDWGDLAANFAGIICFDLLFRYLEKRRGPRG